MPGKRMGSAKRIRGGRPAPRRTSVPQRRSTPSIPRRSASINRSHNRAVKRQNVRQQARKISPRPRPVVRPARVPSKRMPAARKVIDTRKKLPQARSKARPIPTRTRTGFPSAGRDIRKGKNAAINKRISEVPVSPAKSLRSKSIRPPRAPRPATSRAIKRNIGRVAATAAAAAGTSYAVHRLTRLNTAAAPQEVYYQVNSIQSSIDELEGRADMSDVRADIANLDANLNHAISLLESARDKGYQFQSDLEDIAYDAMSRWQSVRQDVEASIEEQARSAVSYLDPVNNQINRLNAVISSVTGSNNMLHETESQVRQALNNVADAESTIEAIYDDIEEQADLLVRRLTQIHWALTQRDEASFNFLDKEDLYMAVKARWDKEGNDDPEGALFLTTKRLIFERKEKIATKKILFIATAKELMQEVMGAQPLSNVENVKAQNKGLFGHQDFLEVDFGKQPISFHLDGQDSTDWAVWIKNAKSGKIEEERTSGSRLSFADLTGDVTQADIVALQDEINELQDEMMLKDTQEELSDLENQLSELSRELSELRARGYVIEKSLEADIQVLNAQWDKIKERAHTTLKYQTEQLGRNMKAIQTEMGKLAGMSANLAAARPLYVNIKSLIASAEAQAEAAEETVLDQYDEYADEVETLDTHLEWVDWMLDAISTASFKLLATESGVAAVEAIWERPNGEPENGILFLTDQRLLWEDREGDYELKIDVPLAQVTEVKSKIDEETEEQRLLAEFSGSAPVPSASFLLNQPVIEEWLQMIGRARSGGYGTDRAVEIKESELDRIRSAPTQCPNCGAAFTAPILRGQTEIICEFCGVSTHI